MLPCGAVKVMLKKSLSKEGCASWTIVSHSNISSGRSLRIVLDNVRSTGQARKSVRLFYWPGNAGNARTRQSRRSPSPVAGHTFQTAVIGFGCRCRSAGANQGIGCWCSVSGAAHKLSVAGHVPRLRAANAPDLRGSVFATGQRWSCNLPRSVR